MKVDIGVRLQTLGISLEELEACKSRGEQKEIVRSITRRKIKESKIHPDISKDTTFENANKITAMILEARDDIMQIIKDKKIRVNVRKEETQEHEMFVEESPFSKIVNDAHREKMLEEALKNFEPNDKVEKEVETHKNGVSNAIAVFNDRYFSVRDAIRKIKSKLTTIFNKDNKDDMER